MDNRILARLTAEYEEKRQKNAREEERRKQEIAAKHPDLFALTEKRQEMVFAAMRALFAAPGNNDPEKIMEEFNQKIASMLTEKGYPPDYLSPIHSCEKCRDTGYYYDDSSRQQMCPCLQMAYHDVLSRSGEELITEKDFDHFDISRFSTDKLPGTDVTQQEYMQVIRNKCLSYAENVPHGPIKTLLLHGGSGLGKTYLLHCIGHYARERGVDTLYVTAYDLLMDLKNAYFSRTGENAREYFEAELLLIDDLGMEPLMEGVTVEQIYHLINSRLSSGLYTAISTNFTRVELQKRYTERLSSRLLDVRTSLALPFLGKDIRLMK